ncbi:MAG TPA: PKD domain-containing protein, partial [Methanomicrobiales archaeon]|nr:PKD domain-containing protein [Methanomicrobiales archaeon]
DWDTSRIQHGSLLPGSQYLFYVMMQPLTVTDAKANGGYTRLELGIEGPVHADFSVNAWNGTTVEFHDLSTGMPSTALFDFGDGLLANITPGSRVNHTYLDAGTFSVKLTVGNTLGTDSVTKQVTVVGTTRDDAYTEVLTDPDILNNDVTGKAVYTSQNPVEAGSTVTGWSTDFGVNTNGWLIFIDDHPKANWEHPVRYVLVDDNNRRTLFQGTSPPKNVAISQIAGVVPTVGSTNDVGSGYSAGYTGGGGGNTVCSQIACPHCYALLVSGGFDRDNNFDRYWNDLSSMYRTLRQTYCYAPDHIQVLMSDGNDPGLDQRTGNGPNDYADSRTDFDGSGHSEVNAAATKDNLVQALTGYQSSLTSADSLFIFTSNHGGKDPNSDNVRLWLWNQEYMWDYEFAGYLNQIPAKVIALTMEQCYSGGFVDNVMASVPAGQTRVIATAASATEPSYGNDFSYWWIDGSMGPAGNPNYNLNAVADGLVSLREDFDYADQHDPSAAQGYEHPQYSGGATADAGLATGLSSCSQCPDPKPVPDPTKPGAFLPYAPGDPLGMGINEDLYGRGSFNQDDAVLFFRDFGWMQANEPVCGFDVNGNRRIDFADIVKLYQEAQ